MARPEVKVRITAQNDSGPALRSLESSLTRIRSVFRTLGLTLSAAAVGQFFRKAIEESASAEAALTRLRGAVANAGGDFTKFGPQAEAAVSALQRLTRFSDDEGREALGILITLTGNVSGSLRNLTLAADIAAKTQKPLAEAAKIVGFAMEGNTRALRQLGIHVKDADSAMAELRKNFTGFAEADGKTFQGRANQLANAFNDLQEAIGNVLTRQDTLGGSIPRVTGLFQDLTKAIEQNEDAIRKWIRTVTAGVIGVVRVAVNLFSALLSGFGKTLADLVLFAGNVINTFLADPLNRLLAVIERFSGITLPFQALRVDTEGAQEVSDKFRNQMVQDLEDIKDAVRDVLSAYGQVGPAIAAAATSSAFGTGGPGGAGGLSGKELDNTASRGAGNTVAGGGQRVPTARLPDILRGVLSPGGPNTNGKSPLRLALEAAAADALEALQRIREQLATGITDALGDGIANGFAAALGRGGIGAGFKALTETLLSGIGRAMVEFGKASLAASTLMLKIKAALASLNPIAAIAASLALIAIGGALSGAAASAFGGSSSSGFSSRGLSDEITRVTVSPTPASQSTAALSPPQPFIYAPTILGKDDQRFQRELVEVLRLAEGRGWKVNRG